MVVICSISKLKLHKRCGTPQDNIVVVIHKNGEDISVCKTCWSKIGNKDWEIGEEPTPNNFAEFLENGRGLANAVLTEYKPKSDKRIEQKIGEEDIDE